MSVTSSAVFEKLEDLQRISAATSTKQDEILQRLTTVENEMGISAGNGFTKSVNILFNFCRRFICFSEYII